MKQYLISPALFTIYFCSLIEAQAELSCVEIFKVQTDLQTSIYFQPFKIDSLVQRVDYRDNFDPKSLDPSHDKLVFSRDDAQLLHGFDLPILRMQNEDRWVETDYGFALLNVYAFRDWTLLGRIIKDPEASKIFIENIAQNDQVYPTGITRESADWIRGSLFINELAVQKAVKRLDPHQDEQLNFQKFKIFLTEEYRFLVRNQETFMFPIGNDMFLKQHEISLKEAPIVLATLARFYLLSHLYVKGPDQGYYRLLADYVDKDSLMLFSRIPELLPSHPVFEVGHFSIEKESIKIGHDDLYKIASKLSFRNHVLSSIQYEVHFIARARARDLLSAKADVVSGSFQIHFVDPSNARSTIYENSNTGKLRKIIAKEVDRMEHLIAKKVIEFETLTGYRLPEARIIEKQVAENADREFAITFDPNDLPAHVLASFFVFVSLDRNP